MNTLEYIGEITASGVRSLKIEGRMKSLVRSHRGADLQKIPGHCPEAGECGQCGKAGH